MPRCQRPRPRAVQTPDPRRIGARSGPCCCLRKCRRVARCWSRRRHCSERRHARRPRTPRAAAHPRARLCRRASGARNHRTDTSSRSPSTALRPTAPSRCSYACGTFLPSSGPRSPRTCSNARLARPATVTLLRPTTIRSSSPTFGRRSSACYRTCFARAEATKRIRSPRHANVDSGERVGERGPSLPRAPSPAEPSARRPLPLSGARRRSFGDQRSDDFSRKPSASIQR